MTELFADPRVAVGQIAVTRDDMRVADAAHWRVRLPSDAIPAGPVAVFQTQLRPDQIGGAVLTQSAGPHDIAPDRPLHGAINNPDPDNWMIAWAHVEADGELRVAVIDPVAAPNGAYAEIAARTEPPYGLAVADMRAIRAAGHGRVHEIVAYQVTRHAAEGLGDLVDLATLAAEVADGIPEYQRAPALEMPWQDRIYRWLHAPTSLGLPYDPDGPDRPIVPADEIARVESLVQTGGSVADWVKSAYRSLTDPAAAAIVPADGAPIRYNAVAALHTACVDPGIARWLGYSGTFQARPEHGERQLFVATIPIYRKVPLVSSARVDGRVAERYNNLTDFALARADSVARGLPQPAGHRRWAVRLLVVPLPTVLPAPPAPPATPRPVTAGTTWDTREAGRWMHTIALDGAVPSGSVSLVTTAPVWRSLHPPTTSGEANRMIASWPRPRPPATRNPVVTAMGLTTPDDPNTPDTMTFEARLGDWVGRWSDPGTVTAGPPKRPRPAPPQVTAALTRSQPSPDGTTPASPGMITVDLTVGQTTAPGSHPIQAVTFTASTGHSERFPLTASEGRDGARRTAVFPAPATVPGQQTTVTITAHTTDTAGTDSDPTTFTLSTADGRPLPAPTAAPRLLVTTRRTNDPTVSITLAINASPGIASYRFLMAAESLLRANIAGLAGPDFRAHRRSRRADEIIDAGGGARAHYTCATATPTPVANGQALQRIDLPSGTSDIVVIKAVPSTAGPDGSESAATPFDDITPVAVVVPISDVPPIPRLSLSTTSPGRITATVTVSGVDSRMLALLDGPIEARIVEAADPNTDPAYWPEIHRLSLTADGDTHTGTVDIGAAQWTRAHLAATVRYPPEPITIPGTPVHNPELRATGQPEDGVESPWGPYSVPCSIDVRGVEPVITPIADPNSVSVEVTGLTTIPPGQPTWIVSFLAGTGPLTVTTEVPVGPSNTKATSGPRTQGTRYAAQLVDPFGTPRPPVIA